MIKKNSPPIQTVKNISVLLTCFTKGDAELGVMQLSRMTGMHKSTVSRLLTSLKHEGFLVKSPQTGKYRLGLVFVQLAGLVLDRLDLRTIARPHLELLANKTQETINIAVQDRAMCINIESIISPQQIQHAGRLGARYPMFCTSTGRVLLAAIPPEERENLVPNPIASLTKNTVRDHVHLAEILDKVNENGYSLVQEEYLEGLSAIASPVHDHTGCVIAAVSVSGPTSRFGPDQVSDFIKLLKTATENISSELGDGLLR
jgi:IclR family KDG regulon transcriptional repressor